MEKPKRLLAVFAGQSNMMGASVYPPSCPIACGDSLEYKHKPKRLGEARGTFLPAAYPVGEFSYRDMAAAYAEGMTDREGRSLCADYWSTTYFCPAMSNLADEEGRTVHPFAVYSEATAPHGVTLAPFFAEEWEKRGGRVAYAHIAKGGVAIKHYFSDEMRAEYERRAADYNRTHSEQIRAEMPLSEMERGAAAYFDQKCKDFFTDAEARFADEDTSERVLLWLQGEADAGSAVEDYRLRLEILAEHALSLGFTRFCVLRIDYFGSPAIYRVMQAAEELCREKPRCHLLTRAASFFTHPEQDEEGWFSEPPTEEYRDCRDSFYGFPNHHINEKGFRLLARRASDNLARVLDGQAPLLEKELILPIITQYPAEQ